VVVNRTIENKEGELTFNKFNTAVKRFLSIKLEHLGDISDDKKLIQAVRNQEPFIVRYPNSNASKDINSIANKIVGLEGNNKGSSVQNLFRKIFDIFS
jgi:flagellar biosynthesis protein FlhG